MPQRTLDEYAEPNGREVGMAVNPPHLLLQRCREAKKAYGHDLTPTGPHEPGRFPKTLQPTVHDGFCGRPGGSGVGSSNDGGHPTPGPRPEGTLAPNGPLQK